MEILTDKGAAKLSRTELRKQKLAEYLAAKGRLKPPNPKPYLKDQGAVQKCHASGKENSVPGTTCLTKGIKTGTALLEKNKDSAPSKSTIISKLRTLPRATSTNLQQIPFKATMFQTAPQHSGSRTQSKGTAIFRNTAMKKPSSEAPTHSNVRDHLSITKVDQRPVMRQDKLSGHKVIYGASVKENPTTAETKRCLVSGKESSSEREKFQLRHPTSTKQSASLGGGTKPKTGTTLQSSLTKKANKDNPKKSAIASAEMDVKKPLIRRAQVTQDRSGTTQNVLQSQVPQTSNKAECKPAIMQKTNPSSTRPRSTCISSLPETQRNILNPNRTVKNPALQHRCTTFRQPSKFVLQAPVPQTLPRPTKTSSLVRAPVKPKTPKSGFNPGTDGVRTVPLDGKKKLSVAQEERMRKLQEWRESKGITYKRPPMPVKPVRRKSSALPPQSSWTMMEEEDEIHDFVCAVDQSLNDCIKLLEQGCSVSQVRDVLSRVPMAQKFAKYWICQVRLMEREGNLDVLATFEEAIRIVREPVDELRSVVFEILKKKEAKASSLSRGEVDGDVGSEEEQEECQSNVCTPKPVGALIRGERRGSSVIKYKITATPGGKKSQHGEKPARVNGSEIRFFTPVRRSARIEKWAPRYPACLQEHDLCVTSQQDLVEEEREFKHEEATPNSLLYVYRENEALKDQVQVQLVYE